MSFATLTFVPRWLSSVLLTRQMPAPATGSALPVTLSPPVCIGKDQSYLHHDRHGLGASVAPQDDRAPHDHGLNTGCPAITL